MKKWIIPNEPGYPSPVPEPAPGGWRDIQRDLSAEPYVFTMGEPPPGISPFAVIREDEGVTVILTRAAADRARRQPPETGQWTQWEGIWRASE